MSTTRTTPKRARFSLIAVSNGCATNWPIWPPFMAGAGPSAAWKTVIRRGTHSDSGLAHAVVVMARIQARRLKFPAHTGRGHCR